MERERGYTRCADPNAVCASAAGLRDFAASAARGQAFKEIGEAAAVRAELLQAKTELHRLSGEHHHVLEHNQELRQVSPSVRPYSAAQDRRRRMRGGTGRERRPSADCVVCCRRTTS